MYLRRKKIGFFLHFLDYSAPQRIGAVPRIWHAAGRVPSRLFALFFACPRIDDVFIGTQQRLCFLPV